MRLRNIPGARETIDANPVAIKNEREYKGKWRELFGNDNPLHIEIGMGKGQIFFYDAHWQNKILILII